MGMFDIKEHEIHLRTCGNCKHFRKISEIPEKAEGIILSCGLEKCSQGIIAFRCELYGGIGNNCDSTDCKVWIQR